MCTKLLEPFMDNKIPSPAAAFLRHLLCQPCFMNVRHGYSLNPTSISLNCDQAEIGKRILGISKFHSNISTLIGLHSPSIKARILIRKLTYLAKLLEKDDSLISHVFWTPLLSRIAHAGSLFGALAKPTFSDNACPHCNIAISTSYVEQLFDEYLMTTSWTQLWDGWRTKHLNKDSKNLFKLAEYDAIYSIKFNYCTIVNFYGSLPFFSVFILFYLMEAYTITHYYVLHYYPKEGNNKTLNFELWTASPVHWYHTIL